MAKDSKARSNHLRFNGRRVSSNWEVRRDGCEQIGPNRWKTLGSISWASPESFLKLTVSAGTETDFASIPMFLRGPILGSHRDWDVPALFHDKGYQLGFDKGVLDSLYRAMARGENVNWLRANISEKGLKVFGWFAWRRHKRRRDASS